VLLGYNRTLRGNFYLGVCEPNWLKTARVPLFVSRRRLLRVKRGPPRARCAWALDSGGFSELSMYGEWRTSLTQYGYSFTTGVYNLPMGSAVENRMLLAAAAYLKEQGYHPVVISTARIQQNERLRVGNYELVLRFTGRKAALAKARGETDA